MEITQELIDSNRFVKGFVEYIEDPSVIGEDVNCLMETFYENTSPDSVLEPDFFYFETLCEYLRSDDGTTVYTPNGPDDGFQFEGVDVNSGDIKDNLMSTVTYLYKQLKDTEKSSLELLQEYFKDVRGIVVSQDGSDIEVSLETETKDFTSSYKPDTPFNELLEEVLEDLEGHRSWYEDVLWDITHILDNLKDNT